ARFSDDTRPRLQAERAGRTIEPMPKLATLAFAAVVALATSAQAAPYHASRNAFGQPDLQGTWTNASLTQLQRPATFKTLTLTDAEAAALEKRRAAARAAADRPTDPTSGAPPSANDPGGYNASWTDPGVALGRINGQVRTSWIVEPADGRLPYSTSGHANYGETLVVETTNFSPGESLRPYFDNSILLSPSAKVTERFTRVSPSQILYQFQVDDPATYTQAWKAEMPLNAAKGLVYEYACHEGN